MSTEADCLFCKIIAGEIPSKQVYSDDAAIAFLDINPFHRGHTLAVPREHVTDVLEGDRQLTTIAPAVDATARLLRDKLQPGGLNIFSSAGAIAGQEIFHLHVHLIPRYESSPGLANLLNRDPDAGADLDAVHAELTS